MPTVGDLFTDVRGGGRTMRVSYHENRGVVVVSLWLGTVCRGSFQMAAGDVSKLLSILGEIDLLVASASASGPQPRGSWPEGAARGSTETAVPDQSVPPFKQTDDTTGTADRSPLARLPVVRIA